MIVSEDTYNYLSNWVPGVLCVAWLGCIVWAGLWFLWILLKETFRRSDCSG